MVLRHAQMFEVTSESTTCIWDIRYHVELSYWGTVSTLQGPCYVRYAQLAL